jgi:hypothetical protein
MYGTFNSLVTYFADSGRFRLICTALKDLGENSCQFLLPGGSLVPSYVCNFYFEKTQTIAKNFTTTKAREKISTDLESLEF